MANEVRLIDANAFYEKLEDIRMEYLEEDTMSSNFAAEVIETVQDSYLKDAPTIDPESLRPTGRWIVIDDDYEWDAEAEDECYVVLECECSVCGERTKKDRPNYCDNCGAKMEG